MRVLMNCAMSLDGKISTSDRSGSAFSSREDRRRMDGLRALADVILVGAETVRREDPPFTLRDPVLATRRQEAGRSPHPAVCVVTASGSIPPCRRIFSDERQSVFLLQGEEGRSPHGLPDRVRILRPQGILTGHSILECLWEQGVRSLLLEGGGRLNALFLDEGLVDEVFLTLCPVLLGGSSSPTPFDGKGLSFSDRIVMRLESCEQVADELFLHYVRELETAGTQAMNS